MLTNRWTPLRPHPEQQRLWRSKARFRIVAAGRSSGKTELARRRMVRALAEYVPGCSRPMYFIAGPTYSQIARVYWDDVKSLVPPQWLVGAPSESDLVIKTIFGSELHLVGLDKPMRIEGTQWCGGAVDESSDIKPGAWSRSIRPALSQYNGWCLRQGVPKRFGVGAAEHREAFEAAKRGEAPDSDAFWWKSADILSAEEIVAAQAELGLDDYKEQYEAQWLDTVGAIFSSFNLNENARPCKYDSNRVMYVSCDFNIDPMAWILAQFSPGGDGCLEVFDELFLHNTNTQTALGVLKGRYPHHKHFVFTGDATSRARRTSATVSDYLLISGDPRFPHKRVCIGDSNPAVADRVAATNALLQNAAGERRLFIDPSCKHLIEDLRLRGEINSSDLTHATDALGYLVWHLCPLRAGGKAGKVIFVPRREVLCA